MKLAGSTGDDIITINAGEGNDTITYIDTPGTDTVHIDGGPGDDTDSEQSGQSFAVFDGGGAIMCQAGVGGTTITVVNVEHITVIGDDGLTTICKWDAP